MTLLAVGAVPLGLFGYTTVNIQRRGLEDAERQLEVSIIDHVTTVLDRELRRGRRGDAQRGAHPHGGERDR